MTTYLVQTKTGRTPWTTRRVFDNLDRARLTAMFFDRAGGWVRIVTDAGEFVEGRDTDG